MTEDNRFDNSAFINQLMNYSPFGPYVQIFILEALRSYSELVTEQPRPEDDFVKIINPARWHDIASDISRQIKERYEAK